MAEEKNTVGETTNSNVPAEVVLWERDKEEQDSERTGAAVKMVLFWICFAIAVVAKVTVPNVGTLLPVLAGGVALTLTLNFLNTPRGTERFYITNRRAFGPLLIGSGKIAELVYTSDSRVLITSKGSALEIYPGSAAAGALVFTGISDIKALKANVEGAILDLTAKSQVTADGKPKPKSLAKYSLD